MNKQVKKILKFAMYVTLYAVLMFGASILKANVLHHSIIWSETVFNCITGGVIWSLLYPLIEKSSKKDKERKKEENEITE